MNFKCDHLVKKQPCVPNNWVLVIKKWNKTMIVCFLFNDWFPILQLPQIVTLENYGYCMLSKIQYLYNVDASIYYYSCYRTRSNDVFSELWSSSKWNHSMGKIMDFLQCFWKLVIQTNDSQVTGNFYLWYMVVREIFPLPWRNDWVFQVQETEFS